MKIFFEEDLYVNEGFTHTFFSQLKISQSPVEPLEEEEMLGNMFKVIAIKEDYLGDPVHLILPIDNNKVSKKKLNNVDRDVHELE